MADETERTAAPVVQQADVSARLAEQVAQAQEDDRNRRAQRRQLVNDEQERQQQAIQETIDEQANMRPVPSQEKANLMRAGAYDPLQDAEEVEQPEGPAARAARGDPDVLRAAVANQQGATYQTRSATSEPARRGPGRPRSTE
jgi:hypothetical protein